MPGCLAALLNIHPSSVFGYETALSLILVNPITKLPCVPDATAMSINNPSAHKLAFDSGHWVLAPCHRDAHGDMF